MKPKIHPTATIEEGVILGSGTSVWHHAHIRRDTKVGEQCIVGGNSYIAYEVTIGNRVKINSNVYICYGVSIEDGVMISAGTIFTNDRFPRATTPDLSELRSSEPDEETLTTHVCEGATIGAGCIIGNDLTIGRFAMVGMGCLVTKDVADFHLVVGSPARSLGAVCRCGKVVAMFSELSAERQQLTCRECGRRYEIQDQTVAEMTSQSIV